MTQQFKSLSHSLSKYHVDASPMGERLLCKHGRIGRREDTQMCAMAGAAGKASRNCSWQVVRLTRQVVARLPGALF